MRVRRHRNQRPDVARPARWVPSISTRPRWDPLYSLCTLQRSVRHDRQPKFRGEVRPRSASMDQLLAILRLQSGAHALGFRGGILLRVGRVIKAIENDFVAKPSARTWRSCRRKRKAPIPYQIRDRSLFVPEVGLEPTHLAILHFECSASTIPPLGRALFEAARISITDNCFGSKSSRPCGYPLYMQIGLSVKLSIDDVPGHPGIEGAT